MNADIYKLIAKAHKRAMRRKELRDNCPICPKCNANKCLVDKRGRLWGMCSGCHSIAMRKGKPLNTDPMCRKCGDNPKHVTSKGYKYSYCRQCRNDYSKQSYDSKKATNEAV